MNAPSLNESPSKKRKGNVEPPQRKIRAVHASMKAPPKRKGNLVNTVARVQPVAASMKAPPKRKGNDAQPPQPRPANCLNESPFRKEGKFFSDFTAISTVKVPQ